MERMEYEARLKELLKIKKRETFQMRLKQLKEDSGKPSRKIYQALARMRQERSRLKGGGMNEN